MEEVRHLYMPDGKVNPEIADRKIIIWGCGDRGKGLLKHFSDIGGEIECFCDTNYDGLGGSFCGKQVIAPESLAEYIGRNIVVTFTFWPQILHYIPSDKDVCMYANYPYWTNSGDRCVLCGSTRTVSCEARFVEFLDDRMFNMNPPVTRWVHCEDCEFSFSSYRPDDEEMSRFYMDYRGEGYNRQRMKYEPDYSDEAMFGEESIRYRRSLTSNFIGSAIGSAGSYRNVLDYGGDKGQFIPELFEDTSRYVYDISGKETVSGVKRLESLEEAASHDWDIIMNCCTLEHVSYPDEILDTIVSMMGRDTLFYLELPCECYGMNVSVHEHINEFTHQTLKTIGDRFSLEILEIGDIGTFGIAALYRKR
ncbi:MAG: hypothetical protein IJT96_01630 [Lachnospiraceae bacterium]|nr:hypothetical protein [Lachnospiraceae bacterium]